MAKARFNIAHILPWPTIGGTELATLRIARGVEGKEFKSVAFHLSGGTAVREMFAAEGFETVAYEAVEPSYRHPQNFLRASFRLAREMRRRQIDLVHCADLLAAYYAALAGRLAGLPVLCHIRNRFEEITRRDQSFLLPVNKFAFVSQDTWRRFGYRVAAGRGTVVYDGIDVSFDSENEENKRDVRREFGLPDTVKIVGMVARVAPQKDYATLVRAAARIIAAYPDVRFLIVGDYSGVAEHREHYEEVKRMLVASGMTPYFVFTDFRTDVSRLIEAMDIFVLSTHHEGLPLVLLEAMAHSKPVIATAVDGVPEIVIDGTTGLLHRHEDDAQLAAQALSLLRDEGRAFRLGEAGRQSVLENWSRERFARDMANLYREMLVGRAASSASHIVEGVPD